MQGAVLLPENPQQGSPPPNNTAVTEMDASLEPKQTTKEEKIINQSSRSDSGIFSTTNTSENMDLSTPTENCDNSDNRSDCSSPGRKYFCPICDKMLTSQHEFTLHIRSHNNESEIQDSEKGFICRICQKVLSSSSSLDRHVLVHSGERPFNCKFCGDTFTTNGNMHRHMRTHTYKSSENYESDGSVDSASSKIEYNNNKVDSKNNNSNKRKLETVDSPNKKHESSNEAVQYFKCPVCERADFNTLSVLENHLEDNHPDYPTKCNICNQVFQNNKQLNIHRTVIHETVNSKHQVVGFRDLTFVDFSSDKFPHIARYECEKNIHKTTGGLKFQCKKCTRAFPCVNSLEIHEKNCMHGSNLNCLEPSESNKISDNEIRRNDFFSRLDLQDNSPSKPCNNNSESQLKVRSNLMERSLALDGPKDLADIQTILSMTSNGSLLQQLQSKTNELNTTDFNKNEPEEETQDVFAVEFRKMKLRGEFPCRLCTAVFPNLRALKGHNRAHLNGNNNGTYRCNMCPHSSFDKAALIRHMRTHNGDRPYECSLCNYAFTTKANCERHLRNRHAKTTRDEVKKSIIYHPSEDPTNDDINKLTTRDDSKKSIESCEVTPKKIHSSTPKILPEVVKPFSSLINPELIPNLQLLKESLSFSLPKEPPKHFQNVNDIIRSENIKSLREEHLNFQNGGITSLLQPSYSFTPKSIIHSPIPQNSTPIPGKLHVKSLNSLQECNNYDSKSEDESLEQDDEPMDLVLDLSKKKVNETNKTTPLPPEEIEEEAPQDLSKKAFPMPPQFNIGDLFSQQLAMKSPKIDPASFYATQMALYRNSLNWSGFPINPLLFPSLQPPILTNDHQEIKERLRMQLCGGTVIADNFTENIKNYQRAPNIGYCGLKLDDAKPSFSTPKKSETKPLSLNIDSGFSEGMNKLRSPVNIKQELVQSPNSVKMVIKNGVLMPKQKQRRYRTERPFTCEHCSARFTLRSNMERHIKQQHPQFWSQRQRGGVGNPGRKSLSVKPNYCDLSIPNYELPQKSQLYDENKEQLNNKLQFAILAQHLRSVQTIKQEIKKDEDEDSALVIDENNEKLESKTDNRKNSNNNLTERSKFLEGKLRELHAKHNIKGEPKSEENQDLVSVSTLLVNASQQQFKEFFKREEHEIAVASEEDEEGLVASGSTSEENVSGTDENRSESETAMPPKKKSAYSLAPNRVSCPYCSRKFPWTSSLRRHILTHTGQKPFKCSHCPLLFTTKSNCDRHLLRKHGNSATTISTDVANNNNNMTYLMRNVPERPFKCSNCPSSTFSTYSNLKKHISCKHSTNAQGDDIKAQGYEAGSSEDEKITNTDQKNDCWDHQFAINKVPVSILEQQSSQNSDLPFKCHLCEGSFSERQDAVDHIKEKHASEYDLLMSKNALDPNATTPDDAHHDEEESEIRGKFPDYSNRKVICAFCMRRFWSAEDLRRHMRTHTGERPFSCDICRRRFTLKHSMLRHRKKHNVNFDNDTLNSDEDINQISPSYDKYMKNENNNVSSSSLKNGEKTDESDCNEGGSDLISKLLGIGDRSIIDKVLTGSADDAAKLLGVKNGLKE